MYTKRFILLCCFTCFNSFLLQNVLGKGGRSKTEEPSVRSVPLAQTQQTGNNLSLRMIVSKKKDKDYDWTVLPKVTEFHYNIGDNLQAECKTTNVVQSTLSWSQKFKSGKPETLNRDRLQCESNSCCLNMTLELFDRDTQLVCIMQLNNASMLTNLVNLRLLNAIEDTSQIITSSEVKQFKNSTQDIMFSCGGSTATDGHVTIGFLNNYLYSYNARSNLFRSYEIVSGTRLFCVRFTFNQNAWSRRIYNYKLYIDVAGGIEELVRGSVSPTLIGIILGAVVITVLLTALIVKLILKCKRKHAEDASRVQYADLELLETKAIQFQGRNNTPYAKVIGVLAPKTATATTNKNESSS